MAASPDPVTETLRYPDFLGIGAQKAGTSWLHENLRRHPGLWLPPIKELQYFNAVHLPGHDGWTRAHRRKHVAGPLSYQRERCPPEKRSERVVARLVDIAEGEPSDAWYGRIFTLAPGNRICGEITPEYSLLPPAGVAHVARLMPAVKVIFSLRDPIERSWSHIRMIAHNEGVESPAGIERIARGREVLTRADYPAMIRLWTSMVAPERFLVLFFDDITARPLDVLRNVCHFIGAEFHERYFPRAALRIFPGPESDLPPAISDRLKEELRPVYDSLAELYPEIGGAWRARHY